MASIVPVETFVLGPLNDYGEQFVTKSGPLFENVTYLGKRGIFKLASK